MRANNHPQGALLRVNPEATSELLGKIGDIAASKPPTSDSEVQERIDRYFEHCREVGMRPGIEGLCLAIGIGRMALNYWSRGINCSQQRTEMICRAKRIIFCYIEQLSLTGKLNPVTSIFLFKNWMGYRDTISLEEANIEQIKILTAAELPKLSDLNELEEKK